MEVAAGKAKWHHVVRVRRRRAAVVYRARRDVVLDCDGGGEHMAERFGGDAVSFRR